MESEQDRQQPAVERRRAPRAKASFPIQVVVGDAVHEAIVKDLSSNGICFTHAAPLDEMSLVELAFELPGDATRHAVKGAVVRCAEISGAATRTFEVALYFVEIDDSSRGAITRFVRQRPG